MSVRFETKFVWSINKNKEIHYCKTENDLAEDSVTYDCYRDDEILTFNSSPTKGMAKSDAEFALKLIKKGVEVKKEFYAEDY